MAGERLAIEDGCGRIAPRSSWRPRPLIEIGNENSLRRESCRRGTPRANQRGMDVAMDKAWAGVDVGKGFHWAHVLDASGESCSLARSKTMRRTSRGS
jgi:hypothetical protein